MEVIITLQDLKIINNRFGKSDILNHFFVFKNAINFIIQIPYQIHFVLNCPILSFFFLGKGRTKNNVEICGYLDGKWLRLAGKVVRDERREAKVSLLEANPILKDMYSADDDNTEVLYFDHATATFY